MHYWRRNNALQTLGVPWSVAAGPPRAWRALFLLQ